MNVARIIRHFVSVTTMTTAPIARRSPARISNDGEVKIAYMKIKRAAGPLSSPHKSGTLLSNVRARFSQPVPPSFASRSSCSPLLFSGLHHNQQNDRAARTFSYELRARTRFRSRQQAIKQVEFPAHRASSPTV